MALPARIRINAQVPFPAMVNGTAPIAISKANGVWTVGFNVDSLGAVVPLIGSYPTDYLVMWDSVARTFSKVSLSSLGFGASGTSGIRLQRSVTASPIVITGTDQILNININTGSPTCALPAAASRIGTPLTFKDVGAQFAAHNLTITPNGAETIDGAAGIVLTVNRSAITLVPFNDGVNSGWAIE